MKNRTTWKIYEKLECSNGKTEEKVTRRKIYLLLIKLLDKYLFTNFRLEIYLKNYWKNRMNFCHQSMNY